MKCPHCKTSDLRPTMIDEYLPAMGCGTCHGCLLSLLYYRHWAETQNAPATEARKAGPALETTDTTSAIACPKCSRVMAKYKLSGRISNRLDVCSTCDEAWLDGGEWELLGVLQLSHKIPAIFTDAWQRRVRRELTEETRREILTRMIGADGTARVEEFRAWLARNKDRSHILTYLYRTGAALAACDGSSKNDSTCPPSTSGELGVLG
jgi:Zn-finger nucleic acid-binding protein